MKKIKEKIRDNTIQEGDCHIWTAGCHTQDYPMMRLENNGRMVIVVRWLAEQKLGKKLTRSTRVKNNCGNVKCVNLDHYDIVDYHTDIDRWKCTPHQIKQSVRKQIQDEFYNTEYYHGIKKHLVDKYNTSYETINKILRERKA